MIATKELSGYLDEYLEEKQEIKNLTSETIKKQTFNINQFISYLENEGIEELDSTNVKKQLRHYRRYCLKGRGNKRTTVKTYMMNILEFINSEEVQEEIQHDPIKMKDIIEVKVEDPETAKKRIEKIKYNKVLCFRKKYNQALADECDLFDLNIKDIRKETSIFSALTSLSLLLYFVMFILLLALGVFSNYVILKALLCSNFCAI